MKGFLGFLSFVLVVGGLQGLVQHFFDTWIPVMGFMRHVYVDGYEIYIGVALLVLGTAVGVAAGRKDGTREG
ncbi:hypothetical protein [Streptomyces sp. UH6]|uniref:hypothetical protein n=1 Tax=Streptomyces sp. UH6 TaxID=2748379 RepID=UPI0015D4DC0D|nr:hypothetical protein [Streptomyces sp. UH6]NYV76836.1 hypothetical protein [Streptomyces sp. UH6]